MAPAFIAGLILVVPVLLLPQALATAPSAQAGPDGVAAAVPFPAGSPSIVVEHREDPAEREARNPLHGAGPGGDALSLSVEPAGITVLLPWRDAYPVGDPRVALDPGHSTVQALDGEAGIGFGPGWSEPARLTATEQGLQLEIAGSAIVLPWADSLFTFHALQGEPREVAALFAAMDGAILGPYLLASDVETDLRDAWERGPLSDTPVPGGAIWSEMCNGECLAGIPTPGTPLSELYRSAMDGFVKPSIQDSVGIAATSWGEARTMAQSAVSSAEVLPATRPLSTVGALAPRIAVGPPSALAPAPIAFKVGLSPVGVTVVAAPPQPTDPAGDLAASWRGMSTLEEENKGTDLRLPSAASMPLASAAEVPTRSVASTPYAEDQGLVQGTPGTALSSEAVPPGSAFALVLGLAVLIPVWLLYRRVKKAYALDNPWRRRIHDAILAHPGATAADLQRLTGLHYTTCQHHLRILQELGVIKAQRAGRQLRYLDNHDRYGALESRALALARVPSVRALLRTLIAKPGLTQAGLAEALHLSRPTVHHHVSRLAGAGVVERRRDGRRMILFPTPAAGVVSDGRPVEA